MWHDDDVVERVGEHTGLASQKEVCDAIEATLRGLGGAIPVSERRTVGDGLPHEIALVIGEPTSSALSSEDDLVARVSEAIGGTRSRAREVATAVCAVLAQKLEPDQVERLRRHLPPELGEWLEPPPERPLAAHRVERRRASPRALSEARPGAGDRSISEARVSGQSGSLARSEEPHADRKLSSAPERSSDTLATGRPGSGRPIGGA